MTKFQLEYKNCRLLFKYTFSHKHVRAPAEAATRCGINTRRNVIFILPSCCFQNSLFHCNLMIKNIFFWNPSHIMAHKKVWAKTSGIVVLAWNLMRLLFSRGGPVWSQDHLDHWNCANPRGLCCLAMRQGYPEAERDVNFLRQFMTIARGTYRYMFGSRTGESPFGLNLPIFCWSSFFSVQKYRILENLQS